MLHDLDEEIQLTPFNPNWNRMYQAEASRIRDSLDSEIIDIQHIGSTAIPSIDAKPIIDIMIGIQTLNQAPSLLPVLVKLGYNYFGDPKCN